MRLNKNIILAAGFFFTAWLGAAVNEWTYRGPVNPWVMQVACRPGHASELLAGTWCGGLFRSTDGGSSFTQLGMPGGNYQKSIRAVAYSSADVVYLCRLWDLLRSTDAGYTWQIIGSRLEQGHQICAQEVSSANPNLIWVGVGAEGVWRSTNGGQDWELGDTGLFTTINLIDQLRLDPFDSQVLFTAIRGRNDPDPSTSGIFISQDGGLTWTQLPDPMDGDTPLPLARFGLDPHQAGHVYATAGGRIFQSTDRGGTWAVLPADPAAYGNGFDILEFDPVTAGTFYIVAVDNNVYKTTDSGASWDPVYAIDAHDNSALTVNPGNPDQLFVGCVTLARSTDAGATWEETSNGLWGKISGSNWDEVAVIPGTTPTWFTSGGRHTWRNLDDAVSWTKLEIDSYNGVQYLGGKLFARSLAGMIQQSTNAGDDWMVFYDPATNGNAIARQLEVHPTDPDTYLLGSGGVWRSTDAGTSWNLLGVTGQGMICGLRYDQVNPAVILAGAWDGNLFRSTDSGSTWVTISGTGGLPAKEEDGAVLFIQPHPTIAHCFFAGTCAGLYRSDDGGINWLPLNDGLSDRFVFSLAVDPSNALLMFAGTNYGTFWSWNGGAFWSNLGGVMHPVDRLPGAYRVTDIKLDPNDSRRMLANLDGIFEFTIDPGAMPGDSDGNHVVDPDDALALARYLAGNPAPLPDPKSADINCDSRHTLLDIITVRQLIASK